MRGINHTQRVSQPVWKNQLVKYVEAVKYIKAVEYGKNTKEMAPGSRTQLCSTQLFCCGLSLRLPRGRILKGSWAIVDTIWSKG